MKRIVLGLLSIVCFAATDVLAAPITYKFKGEIEHDHQSPHLPSIDHLVDFFITGTFDYDPAGIPDTDPSPTQGAYAGAITNLHFELIGQHFSALTASLLTGPSSATLHADLTPYPGFESTVFEILFDPIAPGTGPGNDAPDQLPGLSELETMGAILLSFYGSPVTEEGETFIPESHLHYGFITFAPANQIPEPGVLALLALAAMGCGIRRRTKK